jgi:hypothetical protein
VLLVSSSVIVGEQRQGDVLHGHPLLPLQHDELLLVRLGPCVEVKATGASTGDRHWDCKGPSVDLDEGRLGWRDDGGSGGGSCGDSGGSGGSGNKFASRIAAWSATDCY